MNRDLNIEEIVLTYNNYLTNYIKGLDLLINNIKEGNLQNTKKLSQELLEGAIWICEINSKLKSYIEIPVINYEKFERLNLEFVRLYEENDIYLFKDFLNFEYREFIGSLSVIQEVNNDRNFRG